MGKLIATLLLLQFQCLLLSRAVAQAPTAKSMVPIRELIEPRTTPALAGQQNLLGPAKRVEAKLAKCPKHLVDGLRGQCYSKVVGNYEYQLCPFDNSTQRDVSFQMLAIYHGVIGVWDGWYTENGSLVAMSMPNGDPCAASSGSRQTVVRFKCANTTELVSVQEFPLCRYNMVLATPLVCHPQAMLAYPCLAGWPEGSGFRLAWDTIYTMLQLGAINKSSYNLLLDSLLFRAQIHASELLAVPAGGAAGAAGTVSPAPPLARQGADGANAGLAGEHKRLANDFVAAQIRSLQQQIELQQQLHRGGPSQP